MATKITFPQECADLETGDHVSVTRILLGLSLIIPLFIGTLYSMAWVRKNLQTEPPIWAHIFIVSFIAFFMVVSVTMLVMWASEPKSPKLYKETKKTKNVYKFK